MWFFIWQAFYLAWPAYLANMAPVILMKLGWLKSLDRPLDGGRKLGADYVFGPNKTWRGLVAAVIGGTIAAGLQAWLMRYQIFFGSAFFDYQEWWPVVGALGGLGAILGDLLKSFFKRRLNIAAGRPWPIFDQLDFIVGFFVAIYFFVRPPLLAMAIVMMLTLVLHPLTNITAYFLKIKKVWW